MNDLLLRKPVTVGKYDEIQCKAVTEMLTTTQKQFFPIVTFFLQITAHGMLLKFWGYSPPSHWRRLVKNILGGQTKILRGKVVISDKCMGISQLLGARARAAP